MSDATWESECRKWRGEVLTGKWGHYCDEWDGLPVDETCAEWVCCKCWIVAEDDTELRRPANV